MPLYQLLRKSEHFSWTPEAQEALDKLKASLTSAPILTPPVDGELLYLYVAATTQVVSLPGFHNDIVVIYLYGSPDMVSKHMEHTSLVCSSGISKAK